MNHLSEEDLVLLYYGEPGISGEHLRECMVCREALASLKRTLSMCDEWAAPEPPPEFIRGVWAQLVPRLYETKRLSRILQVSFAGLALIALLIVAFTAGRVTKQPSITAGLSRQARNRILEISLADHLDRAGMLLTEISNVSYSQASEFAPERNRAEDLVEEGRLMRQVLARQGESATLSMLDEVERCLIEIANTPEQITPKRIELLQQRIESRSLVFKVRVIETNLRTEGQKS